MLFSFKNSCDVFVLVSRKALTNRILAKLKILIQCSENMHQSMLHLILQRKKHSTKQKITSASAKKILASNIFFN